MRQTCAIAIALMLTACGGEPDGQQTEGRDADTPPAQYVPKTPVDRALVSIPPADRRRFQQALACEIRNNEGEAIQVTPEYIEDLQGRLEADPSLAEC